MAFTGTAAIEMISSTKARITGLSLAGAASGTIGLDGGTGEVDLPALFKAQPYTGPAGTLVTLIESIEVRLNVVTAVTTLIPISVVKTGTEQATWLATLTNTTAATASAGLEIIVEFLGS